MWFDQCDLRPHLRSTNFIIQINNYRVTTKFFNLNLCFFSLKSISNIRKLLYLSKFLSLTISLFFFNLSLKLDNHLPYASLKLLFIKQTRNFTLQLEFSPLQRRNALCKTEVRRCSEKPLTATQNLNLENLETQEATLQRSSRQRALAVAETPSVAVPICYNSSTVFPPHFFLN